MPAWQSHCHGNKRYCDNPITVISRDNEGIRHSVKAYRVKGHTLYAADASTETQINQSSSAYCINKIIKRISMHLSVGLPWLNSYYYKVSTSLILVIRRWVTFRT